MWTSSRFSFFLLPWLLHDDGTTTTSAATTFVGGPQSVSDKEWWVTHKNKLGLSMKNANQHQHDNDTNDSLEQHRTLAAEFHQRMLQNEECNDDSTFSCIFVSIFDDDTDVYESCGVFLDAKDNKWCDDADLGTICCGSTSDCCDPKWAVIIPTFVAFILAIAASIYGCCVCCTCCPVARHRQETRQAQQQNAATAAKEEPTAVASVMVLQEAK
jgi:hypothetical protein